MAEARRCGARPDPRLCPPTISANVWADGCELPRGHAFSHLIWTFEWRDHPSSEGRPTVSRSRRLARIAGLTLPDERVTGPRPPVARSTAGAEGRGASRDTTQATAKDAGPFSLSASARAAVQYLHARYVAPKRREEQ